MKPLQGDLVHNNSCFCTSCDSKSESDRQTFKRLLVQGSRINRLLTSKYHMHLRQSHLLEKLIKTRALYDALRSQLLSGSESSASDLKPRKSSREMRSSLSSLLEAKRSSDIFALVNLVDKGAAKGMRKLSSKLKHNENVQKNRRNRQVHAGGNILSRSSVGSKQETGEAKNIKSDPCTRACYKHEKNKKSRKMFEKNHLGQQITERKILSTASNDHKFASLNHGMLRKSHHQLKRGKAHPSPYMEYIGEGSNKTKIKSKLTHENAMKKTESKEMLKLTHKHIKDSLRAGRIILEKKVPEMSSMVDAENVGIGGNKLQIKSNITHENAIRKTESVEMLMLAPKNIKDTLKAVRIISQKKEPGTSSMVAMENIGESGNKTQIKTQLTKENEIRITEPIEKLKLAQTEINDSFKFDRKYSQKKEPESRLNRRGESMIHDNKTATKFIDHVNNKRKVQCSELKLRLAHKTRKVNQGRKENTNKSDISSSFSTSIPKETPFIPGDKRQKRHSRGKTLNKKQFFSELNTEIAKNPKKYTFEESNRQKKPKESKTPPQKDPADEVKKIKKLLSFYFTQRKKPIKSKTVITPGIEESVFISSIKKSTPVNNKKTASVSSNQTNKSKTKLRSLVLLRKNLRLLSVPLHRHERSVCHKKPSSVTQKNIKGGSHTLKRCLCSLKLKINETKSSISKNVTNENLNIKDKQIILLQNLLGTLKNFFNTSSLSLLDSKNLSGHVTKCECPDYVNQSPAVKRNKRTTQNKTNAYLGIKHNVIDDNQPVPYGPEKDISVRTKLLIHAFITDYVCKKVEEFMYKHNFEFGAKSTSQHHHAFQCKCFDKNSGSKEKGIYKNQCDKSIITQNPWKFQNQSVILEQLEKENPSSSRLKITQIKVKVLCKCGDETKQIPNKKSHARNSATSTRTKYGLRRCFCTLQLSKKEKKKYNKRNEMKVTIIQPNIEVQVSQNKFKLTKHDIPYEYDSYSHQEEGRKWKKLFKSNFRESKSNISFLTYRSMLVSGIKGINSILISHRSETLIPMLDRNKTQSSDISTHRVSKRSSCFCFPMDKYNKMKRDTKIRLSEGLNLENDIKSQYKTTLLVNKKAEESYINKQHTFKLRKKRKYGKKSSVVVNTDTKSNIITDKMNPDFRRSSKLIESKYTNQLKSYKPKHLKPFKLEKNKSNTLGLVTKKAKMKSMSNDTRTLRSTSNVLYEKSDFQQRNTSLLTFKKMTKYSELSHLTQSARVMDRLSKRRVNVGSNFSFNIEISKSISRENYLYQNRPKNRNDHFSIKKQEGNFQTKRYSSNQTTQLGTKRVSPVTNRTLQMSKMDKHRRSSKSIAPFRTKELTQVYAVNTVASAKNKMKTPEILEVDHDFPCIDSLCPINCSRNISSHTKQWQYFKENPTCGFSISMIAFKAKHKLQISSKDQSLLHFASNDPLALRQFTAENSETENEQNIRNPDQRTGLQPLLRRCYCTMNINVSLEKRKLLDCECEPGICIPGECDHECQKLIMKRSMRKVSRMSGTESRSRSSSCATTSSGGCAKKLQADRVHEPKYRTRGHDPRRMPRSTPHRPQGLKYQKLPGASAAPAPANRQAAPVDSKFSFHIEFSKGSSKSAPTTDFVRVPKRQTSSRSSTTYLSHSMDRGTKYCRHNRETQSMMRQVRHRASNVTLMLKRRFFTLKLQKKGRQQKELESKSIKQGSQGTSTPPEFQAEIPVLKTTERDQNTIRKRRLLPYEREPGICIPGECDPYECLEIKRRNKHTKDFGTDSMAPSTSSASMTSSQKRKRKRIQARSFRAKHVRSRTTAVRSKPSVMTLDTINRQGQDRPDFQSIPSRQAVKINSNFSFNIEFYKDQSGPCHDTDPQTSEVNVQRAPKPVRKVQRGVCANRSMRRDTYSQDGTSTRDEDSQIGIYHRVQSTMTTGYPQRCFSTVQLQGLNVDASTQGKPYRFAKLKRCFCTLKLMSAYQRQLIKDGNVGHERSSVLYRRIGRTQTRRDEPDYEVSDQTQTRGLLPYAYGPGVCEPGFCDPNECIKLIRKRLLRDQMTDIRPRTRSTSLYFSSSKSIPSRARMTQSRSNVPRSRMTQSSSARLRRRRRQPNPGESVIQEKVVSGESPQTQAVRIGSNISFYIEFCKDKGGSPNLNVQAAAPIVKRCQSGTNRYQKGPIPMRDMGYGAYRRVRNRDRGLRGRRFPTFSRDSQVEPTQRRDKGLGEILRRYLCTLQLQKKIKRKSETKVMAKAASIAVSKAVSKAEAKAKAKAKNKAEPKAKTKAGAKGDTKDETEAETKGKCKATTKAETKDISKAKTKAETKDETEDATEDAIEDATKGETLDPTKAKSKAVMKDETEDATKGKCKAKTKAETKDKKPEETIKSSKKSEGSISAKKSEGSSIITAREPKERIMRPKKTVGRFRPARQHRAFPHKLEPYECEPGICVPDECDPCECLKRIKRRLMYSSGTTTVRRETRFTANMARYGRGQRDSDSQSDKQRKKSMRTRDPLTRYKERKSYRERRPCRQVRSQTRSVEYRSTEKSNKQAVKTGSNFKINKEFAKDKSSGGSGATSRPMKQYVVRYVDKPKITRNRSTEGQSTYFRNKRAQSSSDNRDRDSQASGSSMTSITTGSVAPFLKRCFCTLQLHCNTENQGSPFVCIRDISKTEIPKTLSREKVTNAEKNRYTRKQSQFVQFRCNTDNQGSPFHYLSDISKPVKQTTLTKEKVSTKYRPKKIQSRSYSPRRRNVQSPRRDFQYDVSGPISSSSGEKRKFRPRIKTKSYSPYRRNRYDDQSQDDNIPTQQPPQAIRDTKLNREAVRLGSNFNLEIELFKDWSPQNTSVCEVSNIVKEDERYKVKKRKLKKLKYIRPRPMRDKVSESNSTKSLSSCGEKDHSRDLKSQSEIEITDSRSTVTPLLKRCFCTLKFEKKGKQQLLKTKTMIKSLSFKRSSKTEEPLNVTSKKSSCKCTSKKSAESFFKSVSTRTKSRSKAEIEPVVGARDIDTKTKNCRCDGLLAKMWKCDTSPKAKECKCVPKTYECNKPEKNKNYKSRKSCECKMLPEPCINPLEQETELKTVTKSGAKMWECDRSPKAKECKCVPRTCGCNKPEKNKNYKCRKSCECKMLPEPSILTEEPVNVTSKKSSCKCTSKKSAESFFKGVSTRTKSRSKAEIEPVVGARDIGTKTKNCRCDGLLAKMWKCDTSPKAKECKGVPKTYECNKPEKNKNYKSRKSCECKMLPEPCINPLEQETELKTETKSGAKMWKCDTSPKAKECKCVPKTCECNKPEKNKNYKCRKSCECKMLPEPSILTEEPVNVTSKKSSCKCTSKKSAETFFKCVSTRTKSKTKAEIKPVVGARDIGTKTKNCRCDSLLTKMWKCDTSPKAKECKGVPKTCECNKPEKNENYKCRKSCECKMLQEPSNKPLEQKTETKSRAKMWECDTSPKARECKCVPKTCECNNKPEKNKNYTSRKSECNMLPEPCIKPLVQETEQKTETKTKRKSQKSESKEFPCIEVRECKCCICNSCTLELNDFPYRKGKKCVCCKCNNNQKQAQNIVSVKKCLRKREVFGKRDQKIVSGKGDQDIIPVKQEKFPCSKDKKCKCSICKECNTRARGLSKEGKECKCATCKCKYPSKKGKECKCATCQCNTLVAPETTDYPCKKGKVCKCATCICNTLALEISQLPCSKDKKWKCSIYKECNTRARGLSKEGKECKSAICKCATCKCATCKCATCKCATCKCATCKCATCKCEYPCKKGKECKCVTCQCNSLVPEINEYPCKKGKECKCATCKCNNLALEISQLPCSKGKECKCSIYKECNTRARGLSKEGKECKCATCKCEYPCKKGKECKCITCKCSTLAPEITEYPCKKAKECKCATCKCNTLAPEITEYPCKKGKECKCATCKCNTLAPEITEYPCKKGKECKCATCKCSTLAPEITEYPCKKGKECKCTTCKCNTLALEITEYPCKKGKECKCATCKCNSLAPEIIEYPCKKGKECKCATCKCNTLAPEIIEYPCKKGKECKCATCKCSTLPLEISQLPCRKSEKLAVQKTEQSCKKEKNFKRNPSTVLRWVCKKAIAKKSKSYPSEFKMLPEPSFKPCVIASEKEVSVKKSDKKTSTKGKFEPLQYPVCEKGVSEPEECTPFEGLKKSVRLIFRKHKQSRVVISEDGGVPQKPTRIGIRIKRAPRRSVSGIAAQFLPGYIHKRTKYEGKCYSPEKVENIVEEPRYSFLLGRDARQGVKISSNFSFNIEFFKEMLPPVMDKIKEKVPPDMNYDSIRHSCGRHKNKRVGSERTESLSAVTMKKKCFSSPKLQIATHPQIITVGRVEEIRPISFYKTKECLVQYEMQQSTKKCYKTSPQEIETIMSFTPGKYDKFNRHKECCICRKCNFCSVDLIKQRAQDIHQRPAANQSTLKKMYCYCKNLFKNRSNKQNTKDSERRKELKKAINKNPLMDNLKPSNSERHPNKAATTDIEKSKSLKVARVSGKNDYKKKYSQFQSGDQQRTKLQNTGIQFVKQNCQIKLNQTIPKHIRFTTLCTDKILKFKPNDAIVTDQKKDSKPVSFLFKSSKFKNSDYLFDLKLCSCCGGIKRTRNIPSASISLDKENNKDAKSTVTPKDIVIPTKIENLEEETELHRKNEQECSCCACKSVSNPKTKQGEKRDLGEREGITCKKVVERCVEYIKYRRHGTTIYPVKYGKEALASESGYYLASNKNKRKKKLEQETIIRPDTEIIDKKQNKLKKLPEHNSTSDSLLVAEYVHDVSKLELTSVEDCLGNLHSVVSGPKGICQPCKSYQRDPKCAWKKCQKAVSNGSSLKQLPRLKFLPRKCVKEGKENLKEKKISHPVTNFALHSEKQALWRRPDFGVSWSQFMLALREKPWLNAYSKFAGLPPRCLTVLQVWKQFVDIILFFLAVAVWSPCLLGLELCRALKCCFSFT